MKSDSKFNTQRVVGIAIFSALSFVVSFICQVIPPIAGFLSLDAKDAVIAIASFVYGPISALIISFLAAFIEFLTFSTTGWYGFIMNFASSAVFSFVAALIYSKWRNMRGALVGFGSAIFLTTAVMLLLNIFVTPLYMKYIGVPMTSEDILDMLPKILLPFNFAKSLMNSGIALLIYKPISNALRRVGILKKSDTGVTSQKDVKSRTLIMVLVGAVGVLISVAIFFVI